MKICVSNLVYGERYTKVFLDYHLKTFVDDSNLGGLSEGSQYVVFTDGKNIEYIKSSVHYKKLVAAIPVKFFVFSAPEDSYRQRYAIQSFQHKLVVQYALDNDMLLAPLTADHVLGKGVWKKALSILSEGYDGVLSHAMRAGYEGIAPALDMISGAPEPDHLFELSFMNQHPAWLAMNWDSPFFSKVPYHIIWSDSQCLVVRGFSVGVFICQPSAEMASIGGNSDIYTVPLLKRPFFVQDWSDLPWAEMAFLMHFFPSFCQYRASTLRVAQWAKQVILPVNYHNLRRATYFKKRTTPIPYNLLNASAQVAEEIVQTIALMV